MSAEKPCRRCLLSEMNNGKFQAILAKGMDGILENDRTEEKVYKKRLSICRSCDNLLSGTCLSCGCYVEIRAAAKKGRCPEKKW